MSNRSPSHQYNVRLPENLEIFADAVTRMDGHKNISHYLVYLVGLDCEQRAGEVADFMRSEADRLNALADDLAVEDKAAQPPAD